MHNRWCHYMAVAGYWYTSTVFWEGRRRTDRTYSTRGPGNVPCHLGSGRGWEGSPAQLQGPVAVTGRAAALPPARDCPGGGTPVASVCQPHSVPAYRTSDPSIFPLELHVTGPRLVRP